MRRPTHASTSLKVGDLARRTGKSIRALRLYEELGLLEPARSTGNFRLYGVDQVARVYWISKLQDMGFTLQQIQGLIHTVESSAPGPEAMTSLRELFRARLATSEIVQENLVPRGYHCPVSLRRHGHGAVHMKG